VVTHTRLGRLARSSNGANSTVRLLGLFVVFCALASPPTVRADSYWIGGSGLWSDSANWNPNTVPDSYTPPNDRVFIWPSDGINRNIGYLDNANIGGLYIDLTGYTGSAQTTFDFNGGNLSVIDAGEYVGYQGRAFFDQIYGGNATSNLTLGYAAGSSGAYQLVNDGSLGVFGFQYVGYDGTGTFTQYSTSSNTIHQSNFGGLILGFDPGATGTYNLSGQATIAANTYEMVGDNGTGYFYQSGASTNTITVNSLFVGTNSSSNGTYSLQGGATLSVTSGNEAIGYQGSGVFSQLGSNNNITVGDLQIGSLSNSSGTYTLAVDTNGGGGYVTIGGSEFVGLGGTGIFSQTGSTVTISGGNHTFGNGLVLGNSSGSKGTYTFSDGNLTVKDNEFVGLGGSGAFNQSGGANTISGGHNLYVGYAAGSNGAYTQSGGTNAMSSLFVGGNSGSTGAYVLSGGSATLAGAGYIGSGGSGVLTVQGAGVLNVAAGRHG
jgi:hypothetical protein